jgi:hypothetical protein
VDARNPIDAAQLERLTGGDGMVFEPTARDMLRFLETTRPRPSRADFVSMLRRLIDHGHMERADVLALIAAGYVELFD